MPSPTVNRAISRASRRVPGLRRLPMLYLLSLAQVAVIAQEHVGRLTPAERRRVLQLVRIGRGRTRNLNARERAELEDLVSKAEPRLFLAASLHRLSPMPVPRPLVDRLVGAHRRRA